MQSWPFAGRWPQDKEHHGMFTTDPDRMIPIPEDASQKRQLGFDLWATPDWVGAGKRLTLRSCVTGSKDA